MIVALNFLKGFLNIKALTGPFAILMGFGLVFGGAATWLREDAINDTNAKWELKLSQAELKAHNEVQEKQLSIERLQKTLALKEKEGDEKAKADAEAIAKQAVEFPLSPDCLKCRVPNERLWVRRNEGVAEKSSSPRPKAAPGS